MMVLEQFVNGGAMLRTFDGVRVFRTLDVLERDFLTCEHTSPDGPEHDVIVFVNRTVVASNSPIRLMA